LNIKNIARTLVSPVWLLDNKLNLETSLILNQLVNKDSLWLDVGCGLKPFLANFKHAHYTGIDIVTSGRHSDMKKPDEYFNGINIPYEDGKFDGILCTQVLEHVEDLDSLLVEYNRVLKINGRFIISVPFVYREHEQPYDFRRFTSYGLEQILTRNGFQIYNTKKCLTSIETIATLFTVYISNSFSKNKFWYFCIGLLISLPILIISKSLSRILPNHNDLYCALVTSGYKNINLKD